MVCVRECEWDEKSSSSICIFISNIFSLLYLILFIITIIIIIIIYINVLYLNLLRRMKIDLFNVNLLSIKNNKKILNI